jgi:hypothetical protein
MEADMPNMAVLMHELETVPEPVLGDELKVVPCFADPEECFQGLRNTVLKYDDPLGPVGVAA